jgi:ribonuclease E
MNCLVDPCPTCGGLGHLVHLPGEGAVENGGDTPRSLASGSGATPQLAPPTLGDGDSLDGRPDLQELDLVNHPSYQDKSGRGGNRRRRRRDPLPSRSNGKEPPVVKDNGSSSVDFKEQPAESTAPVLASKTEDDNDKTTTRGRGRTGGRSDAQGDTARGRKSAAPPQVITVEMTPDEQRIYAMMGISPTVLSTEAVTDPRNVTVSVVLPGQVPPAAVALKATETMPVEGSVETPAVALADEPSSASPKAKPSRTVRTRSDRSKAKDVNAAVPEAAPEPASEPSVDPSPNGVTPDPVEAPVEAEAAATVRRRRRRRSSSAGDGDE